MLALLKNKWKRRLMVLAPVGRMVLTNYLAQTIFGIFIFYGIGLGLGARTGLAYVMLISIGVFLLQALFSHLWLNNFYYGPVEWIWRQLTYGKKLPLRKKN